MTFGAELLKSAVILLSIVFFSTEREHNHRRTIGSLLLHVLLAVLETEIEQPKSDGTASGLNPNRGGVNSSSCIVRYVLHYIDLLKGC